MTALEKAARALHACYHNSKWETAGQLYQDMYRLHARAVISSIEVDDAMVEVVAHSIANSRLSCGGQRAPDSVNRYYAREAISSFLASILEDGAGR